MTYPSPQHSNDRSDSDTLRFYVDVETPSWGGAPITKLRPRADGLLIYQKAAERFSDEYDYPLHRLLDIVTTLVSQRQRGTVAQLVITPDGTARLHRQDETHTLADSGDMDEDLLQSIPY